TARDAVPGHRRGALARVTDTVVVGVGLVGVGDVGAVVEGGAYAVAVLIRAHRPAAYARRAGVVEGALVAVVALRTVGLGGVRAHAGQRIGHAGVVAGVERR